LATPDLPLEVHVYTHYPLAGHGLWFDQVHPPGPRAGGTPSRVQWRQDLQEDSRARYELARAAGHRSRRTINAWLKAQGLAGLGGATYQQLLMQAAAEAEIDPATVPEPALERALDRVVEFLHAGPLPVSLDEQAALTLEYASSVDAVVDRLAGLLLARVLLTVRAGRGPLPLASLPVPTAVTGTGPPDP
ncbi:MAG TPA: hypothetical protein VES89_09460, partial [Candidatus Competibacteraceae bacterium]|nr:hypothetical protein [Candidatus Competibacteraceae bacterium]